MGDMLILDEGQVSSLIIILEEKKENSDGRNT